MERVSGRARPPEQARPPERALMIAMLAPQWGSSRLRAWWPAKYADWLDVIPATEVLQTQALNAAPYAAVVFQKWGDRTAQQLARALQAEGRRVWWDITDPLWLFAPETAGMFDVADGVVASNAGLADLAAHTFGREVAVIVDRMDPAFHPTVRRHRESAAPVLLWFGNKGNRAPSLAGRMLPLLELKRRGRAYRLRVCDDGPPGAWVEGVGLAPDQVEWHPWRLDTFHEELTSADVALLPPHPGWWGTLKSDNKRATAWWAGLPVVTLEDAADIDHAEALLADAARRAAEGAANRRRAEAQYDVRQSVAEWARLLFPEIPGEAHVPAEVQGAVV